MTGFLTKNNDIYLNNSKSLVMGQDIEALKISIQTTIQTLLGEYFMDSTIGLPYKEVLWVGVPDYELFSQYVKSAILAYPEVSSISSYTYSTANNTFSYNATINTIYGATLAI